MLPSPATSSMLDRWEIYVDRAYEAQGDVPPIGTRAA
jgi:hypothetical protein